MLLEQTQGAGVGVEFLRVRRSFFPFVAVGCGGPIVLPRVFRRKVSLCGGSFTLRARRLLSYGGHSVCEHTLDAGGNAVARMITRPKDNTSCASKPRSHRPAPRRRLPGQWSLRTRRRLEAFSYHGPRRYSPKDGWFRLRPVANPGYRFVKWDAGEEVEGAVLDRWELAQKKISGASRRKTSRYVCKATPRSPPFEFAPNLHVEREKGALEYLSEDDPRSHWRVLFLMLTSCFGGVRQRRLQERSSN